MGLISNLLTQITDVGYQQRILQESNISEGEFNETVFDAKRKINLKPDEHILFNEFSNYMEPRSIREYVSGRAGVRITKGVWIGGTRGRAESHYELRIIDYGALTITNKRLIFTGKFKNHSINLEQINFVKPYDDAIEVAKISRQQTMYFSAVSGVLPYLAIKDVKAFSKLKEIYDYFKFLGQIPTIIKDIEFSGKVNSKEVPTIVKNIDKIAIKLKIEYNKNKLNIKNVNKLNSDVEKLIDSIHSIAKTIKSTMTDLESIEKTFLKNKTKPKSTFGKISSVFTSDNKKVNKLYKQKYGTTVFDKVNEVNDETNEILSTLKNDIENSSNLIEKEYSNTIKLEQ